MKDAALVVAAARAARDGRPLFLPVVAVSGGRVPDIGQIPGDGAQESIGAGMTDGARAGLRARVPDEIAPLVLDDAAGSRA